MVSPQFCLQASHRMASCQMPLLLFQPVSFPKLLACSSSAALFHTFLQPSLPAPSAYATHPGDGSCPDLCPDRPFRRPELSSRQKALIHRLLVSDSPSRRNTEFIKDGGTRKRTRVQFRPAPLLSPHKGIGRGSRELFCLRPHTDKTPLVADPKHGTTNIVSPPLDTAHTLPIPRRRNPPRSRRARPPTPLHLHPSAHARGGHTYVPPFSHPSTIASVPGNRFRGLGGYSAGCLRPLDSGAARWRRGKRCACAGGTWYGVELSSASRGWWGWGGRDRGRTWWWCGWGREDVSVREGEGLCRRL